MLFHPEHGGSGAAVAAAELPPVVEELPTLLVTREIKEHANVYHTYTGVWVWGAGGRCTVPLSAPSIGADSRSLAAQRNHSAPFPPAMATKSPTHSPAHPCPLQTC